MSAFEDTADRNYDAAREHLDRERLGLLPPCEQESPEERLGALIHDLTRALSETVVLRDLFPDRHFTHAKAAAQITSAIELLAYSKPRLVRR